MEGAASRRAAQDHLNLGAGTRHVPGVNVDIRPLPGVVVADCRNLARFRTGTFRRVTARDLIEHLPFRDIPQTLREWLRVLRPGGFLWIQTPDARYAASLIDGDGPTIVAGEDRWEHFNRVMFGHQDYPENFHASFWTPDWLTRFLEGEGATVRRVGADVPGSFRLVARK